MGLNIATYRYFPLNSALVNDYPICLVFIIFFRAIVVLFSFGCVTHLYFLL